MKTKLIFALLSVVALNTFGKSLTPDQALARLHTNGPVAMRSMTAHSPQLVKTVDIADSNVPACYIFATDTSFLVLSADDNAVPLLGYGDSATFNPANMPPAMQAFLKEYAREIASASHHTHSSLLPIEKTRPERARIEPLMITKWNQTEPYNLKCPRQGTEHTLTGCVATAFAQIAYFHRWPAEHGTGKKSYRWNNRNISFNFDTTKFLWDDMLPEYTTDLSNANNPANIAVATLMYGVGIASEMAYSTDGSGTSQGSAIMGLAKHMGYSPNAYVINRNSFGVIEWEDIIYNEIANNRPVPYTGANASPTGDHYGAHEFVVDGYASDGFFHINWGWGGISDGYFILSALDPEVQGAGGSSGGYSYESAAVIGFAPAVENETFDQFHIYYSEAVPLRDSANIQEEASYAVTILTNQSSEKLPETIIALFVFDDEYSNLLSPAQFEDLPPSYYYPRVELGIEFPDDLPERLLLCLPIFSTDGGNSWFYADSNIYNCDFFAMERSGDEVQFFTPSINLPEITDILPTSLAYAEHPASLRFTATNTSESDDLLRPVYCGMIIPDSDEIIPVGNLLLLTMLPGETAEFDYTVNLPEYVGKAQLAFFTDNTLNGQIMLSTPIDIEILENPGLPQLEVLPGYIYTAKVPENSTDGTVTFDGDIKCTKGLGTLWTYVEVTNNTTSSWNYDASLVNYVAGETSTVHVETKISDTHPGDICTVRLLVHDGTDFVELLPNEEITVTEISGVDDITTDHTTDTHPTTYYNLQGINLGSDPSHLPAGIYIRSGKKIRLPH